MNTTLSKRLQRERAKVQLQKDMQRLKKVPTSDAIGRIRSELRKR